MWGCCSEVNNPIIPNVIAGWCAEIDKTDPENWVISAPCPSEVISSDESVSITQETGDDGQEIYDLSFACCDRLVAVCESDENPGFLQDKIVAGDAFVEIDTACIADGVMEISLDLAALTAAMPDEKVKARSDGTANYLNNLITATAPLQVAFTANNVNISINQSHSAWKRPAGKRRYWTSVEFTATHGTTGTWAFDGFTGWLDISNDAAQLASANAITFTKSWLYRVSVRWIVELNAAFHAFRVISLSANSALNGALDRKWGAWNSTNWIDLTSGDGKSMYNNSCIVTVSATEIVQATAWDTMLLGYRWSTEQTDHAIAGKGRIIWDNGSPYTSAINVWWFALSWEYVDNIF